MRHATLPELALANGRELERLLYQAAEALARQGAARGGGRSS